MTFSMHQAVASVIAPLNVGRGPCGSLSSPRHSSFLHPRAMQQQHETGLENEHKRRLCTFCWKFASLQQCASYDAASHHHDDFDKVVPTIREKDLQSLQKEFRHVYSLSLVDHRMFLVC